MNDKQNKNCTFVGQDGTCCVGKRHQSSELCYWHDPDVSKKGPEVKEKLEAYARAGHSLEGVILKYAQLEDVHLSFSDAEVDLRDANLYRANLKGAHLYSADCRGANLMKANLYGANLNDTQMERVNLLGANLKTAKLERVSWGEHLLHEGHAEKAQREGRHDEAKRFWIEAEETYRSLRQAYENRGLVEEAGRFFQKEMCMKRYQLPIFSLDRIYSKTVDLFSGYGEEPLRVITFSLTIILLCAILYFIFGINGPEGYIGFEWSVGLNENLSHFMNCVYYSIVTFTTLGYGDITPLNYMRGVAAVEAFIGSFTIALFVVVFVKKMTR